MTELDKIVKLLLSPQEDNFLIGMELLFSTGNTDKDAIHQSILKLLVNGESDVDVNSIQGKLRQHSYYKESFNNEIDSTLIKSLTQYNINKVKTSCDYIASKNSVYKFVFIYDINGENISYDIYTSDINNSTGGFSINIQEKNLNQDFFSNLIEIVKITKKNLKSFLKSDFYKNGLERMRLLDNLLSLDGYQWFKNAAVEHLIDTIIKEDSYPIIVEGLDLFNGRDKVTKIIHYDKSSRKFYCEMESKKIKLSKTGKEIYYNKQTKKIEHRNKLRNLLKGNTPKKITKMNFAKILKGTKNAHLKKHYKSTK